MKIQMESLNRFVTPVFQGILSGPDVDKLFEELRTSLFELSKTEPSDDRSNSNRVDSWHSTNSFLPNLGHPFSTFGQCTDSLAQSVFDQIGMSGKPHLAGMWAIINPFGGSNRPHIHPETHLAGVVYVQCPAHCGDLFLVDPRTGSQTLPVDYSNPDDCIQFSSRTVRIKPKDKSFVFFPGYIEHYVDTNLSQDTDTRRVVIAFNYRQKRND